MDAIQLLTTRSSTPRLQAPKPGAEDWQTIQRAAVRVPDHGGLKPWRFMVFDNEAALTKLGELYAKAAVLADSDVTTDVVEKAKGLPHRAPLVVAVIAKYIEHPKVPRVEQIASASCAAMAMQQAAFALGYGGVWRTGSYAHNPHMKTLLGLADQDEIVGYLYLGTPIDEIKVKPERPFEPHFTQFVSD